MNLSGKLSLIFLLISVGFLAACGGPSRETQEVLNTALNLDQAETLGMSDTLRETIYGDFAPNVIILKVNRNYGLYDTVLQKSITETKYENIGSFAYENKLDFTLHEKYGYLNAEGKEIVEPLYDFTSGFSGGLASVRLNEKWGYIDAEGKVVIPLEYEMAWNFKTGTGAVKKEGKWGFINPQGKYVLAPMYDDVTRDFDDSLKVANVQIGNQHFFIDKKGKRLRDSEPYEKFQTP